MELLNLVSLFVLAYGQTDLVHTTDDVLVGEIMEGDIMVDENLVARLKALEDISGRSDEKDGSGHRRRLGQAGNPLWENGIFYYAYDKAFPADWRVLVRDAMDAMEETLHPDRKCIQFVESDEEYHVKFVKESGCYSHLGRVQSGFNPNFQKLSLNPGCWEIRRGQKASGVIVHELMHALGFIHEHSRSDRDDYIRMNFENVTNEPKGSEAWKRAVYNWSKFPEGLEMHDTTYDYNSIMHYLPFAGSINLKPVMEKINQPNGSHGVEWQNELIDRYYTGMSALDIFEIRQAYNCPSVLEAGGKCSWMHRSDGYVTCNAMPSCKILKTLKRASFDECKQECCENDKCMSVDWNKDLCHLKTQNHFTAKTAGYWYQGKDGRFPNGHWSKRTGNTDPGVLQTPAPSPAPTPAPRPDCVERTTIGVDIGKLDLTDHSKHLAAIKKCEAICEDAGYSKPEDGLFETSGLWVERSKHLPSGCFCKGGIPVKDQYDTLGYSFPCDYEPEQSATPAPECSMEIREIWADVGFNPDLPYDDTITAEYQCDQLCWDEGYTVATIFLDSTASLAGCTCFRGSGPACEIRDPKPTPVPTHASCKLEEIDAWGMFSYAEAEARCPRFCRREDPDYITGRPWMSSKSGKYPKGCLCVRCDDDDDVKTPGCEDWCYEEFDCLSDPNDAACGECDLPKC